MEVRKWISEALMWMSFSDTQKTWVHNPPDYPDWTLPPNHGVPAPYFIRIWQGASSLNEVKKSLFWCSLDDLESQRKRINEFLMANHYEPLQSLSIVSTAMLSTAQLETLEAEGLLSRVEVNPHIENEEQSTIDVDHEDYDAARAVFDAVTNSSYSPHSHIASVEVHGGRFRGRH